MIDHEAALRFDIALDQFVRGETPLEEPLLETARTVQQLGTSRQAAPSDAFRTRLRGMIAGGGSVDQQNGHHPAVEAAIPAPLPRRPVETRVSHRWLAIAAALLLLLVGGGAIVLEGIGLGDDSEPSAIPAASLGTVEASPESVGEIWTVSPPQGVQGSSGPAFIEDGLMYSILTGPSGPYAQVIDIETGRALWSSRLAVSADLTASVWRGLLLFTGTGGPNYELFAFDGRTGKERWSIPFEQRPVNLIVDGDRAFVLGSGNLVVAIDLESQQEVWRTDLSAFDPDWEPYGGMNRYGYFNDGRLALTNGVLAVLISDGRLIALDAGDGSDEWTSGHADDGRATVHVIDGKFVVTAEGKTIFDVDDDPYLLPPSPVPSYDPKTQPCERTVEHLSATDSSVLGDYETSATSLDPITGSPSWKLRTHAAVWIVAADDTRLFAMIRPGWDSAIGNEDFPIYCLIDGETGDVARIGDAELATFTYGGSQSDELWGMGVVPSGMPFGIGHLDFEFVKNLPHLDLDPETFTGFRWVQEADGLILITEQDGTVIGFPERMPDSVTVAATPAIATPAANMNWIAPGPDKSKQLSEDGNAHLIEDGRVVRAFSLQAGACVVQAIDARTGNILWETEIDSSGRFMIVSGDVLLVAGKDDKGNGHLVALDAATGQNVWTTDLSDEPVGMTVAGITALMLGSSDTLDAIDIETGQTVYAVDIHGDAQSVNPTVSRDRYIDEHRMAIDGETLYVTLADGSVVAVDWETGAGKWWSLRSIPGQVQIYVVDGVVVTVDQGDLRKIQSGYRTKSLAERTATPIPATPSPLAFSPTCNANDAPASPAATPFSTGTGGAVNAAYRGLDPTTGAVLWANSIPGVSAGQLDVDSGILTIMFDLVEGSTEPPEFAYCLVDADSGQISNFDPLDDVSAPILRIESSSYLGEGWRLGIVIDGYILPVPPEYAEGIAGTVVVFGSDVEDALKDGWFWQEAYENRIYYSTIDGDLVSIPIPDE